MSRGNWIILAACLAVAVGGYFLAGKPGMGDQPMSARQAGLMEKVRTDPQSLTPAETLSRLEATVKERPGDPQPHCATSAAFHRSLGVCYATGCGVWRCYVFGRSFWSTIVSHSTSMVQPLSTCDTYMYAMSGNLCQN